MLKDLKLLLEGLAEKIGADVGKALKKPLIVNTNNIVKVLEVPLDSGINQCQGFTYNKTLDAFFIACISGDNEKQVFYKYNTDFSSLLSKQTFTDKNRLGHCNTLCSVDDKIYVTNGAVNPNQVAVMNGNMSIETTLTFPNKVFNLGTILPRKNLYLFFIQVQRMKERYSIIQKIELYQALIL